MTEYNKELRQEIREELFYAIQNVLSERNRAKVWDMREEIRANPLIVLELLRDELDRRMREEA